ncbi:HDOD domain-containing protein [Paraglaciecola agarilytica]|uniref:HDOD domain-containing protein n=1 Tax=Paraglaciecola chathamensis TaxID=368405 RepID=UPI001C0A427E|nr:MULTISPECIES: HDOD domain-containing protein [Paraglaciecola]MBU3017563.1 HDOD domain-containing protein [Paraglaciecola agarilytica]MDO6841941.1 HDOD domain-containing protein [Paraglaciecola chathamensis]
MNALEYAEKAGDLFVLPDSVTKIKQLIDDGSASINEVAEVINYDPAVAAQILKIANSALYKFPTVITTVSKAIQVIGTDSVYDLVLAYGISHAFKDMNEGEVDFSVFWELGVSCGLLAKYIAQETSAKNPDKMFVCGLLHNIGELAVLQIEPDTAAKCSSFTTQNCPVTLQTEHLGVTYAEISAELLKLWGIPSEIYGPIAHQHASLHEAQSHEEKVLQLAANLALNNVYGEIYGRLDNIEPEQYEELNLDEEALEAGLDFTNMQLISTLAIFSPSTFSIY